MRNISMIYRLGYTVKTPSFGLILKAMSGRNPYAQNVFFNHRASERLEKDSAARS